MANGIDPTTAILGASGGLLGLAGGLLGAESARRGQTRFRRRQRKAIREAREFAEERLQEILGPGTLFGEGVEFLRGTFGDAAESPLAQDFVKQIRAAQAARGTFSGAGAAAAEAGGLAAFSQELRGRLLPQVQAFAFAPEQLRQSIIGFEAPLRTSSRTGAPLQGVTPPALLPDVATNALNQALAGGFGGIQLGVGLQNLQTGGRTQLERDRAATRRSAQATADLQGLFQPQGQQGAITQLLSLLQGFPGIAG